jgi:hypothetical protein
MFTGNRGRLVADGGAVVRHHSVRAWITCVTSFRGRSHPLDAPGVWTPLFFLDEAVALAAGHRPCGHCRYADHVSYRDAVRAASSAPDAVSAPTIDRRLAVERLRPGRGVSRAGGRILWSAPLADLPVGTVVVDTSGHPHLVSAQGILPFSFSGWRDPVTPVSHATVDVLTPPTSVAALRHGFSPTLHESALQRLTDPSR